MYPLCNKYISPFTHRISLEVLSLPLFYLIDRSSFHDGLDVYFGSIFKVARLWPERDVKYGLCKPVSLV